MALAQETEHVLRRMGTPLRVSLWCGQLTGRVHRSRRSAGAFAGFFLVAARWLRYTGQQWWWQHESQPILIYHFGLYSAGAHLVTTTLSRPFPSCCEGGLLNIVCCPDA